MRFKTNTVTIFIDNVMFAWQKHLDFTFFLASSLTDIRKCPVSLPQKSSKTCKILRERELNRQRGIFQLAIKPPLPMPLVNMTSQQLTAHHSQDEFAKEYYLNYLSMVVETRRIGEQWITQYPEEIADIQEYKNYFKEFRESMANVS